MNNLGKINSELQPLGRTLAGLSCKHCLHELLKYIAGKAMFLNVMGFIVQSVNAHTTPINCRVSVSSCIVTHGCLVELTVLSKIGFGRFWHCMIIAYSFYTHYVEYPYN